MDTDEKLFVVVRSNQSEGQQGVQAVHAAAQFIFEHFEEASRWFNTSNYLAFLEVPDEPSLHALLERAQQGGYRASKFQEPDQDNSVTAIALEPAARTLTAGLTPALRRRRRYER